MSQRAKTATGKPSASRQTGGTALWELRVTVPEAQGDAVGAFLIERGAGGVVEEPVGRRVRLVTYGRKRALERLGGAVTQALGAAVPAEVRPAPASLRGWDTAWMKNLVPVVISRTLVLAPTTAPDLEPGGRPRSVVRLEPALAFGFGEHPTTRLAARAVERICRRGAVKTVLDMGTGSGVLAVVAAVSGAAGVRRIVGIDVDPASVRAAERNASLNGVETLCRFSETPLSRLRSRFDLVVANVDRTTLLACRDSLLAALAPRATLLMTGFLSSDVREIEQAFAGQGLEPGRRAREGDWALVTVRRA